MSEPDLPLAPDEARSRAAARRRTAMRLRLIESAMLVFAEKGGGRTMIDDVIQAAGVSRGTFYRYFPTTGDLFASVVGELGRELRQQIDTRIADIVDPAEGMAVGLKLFIGLMQEYPLIAQFAATAGLEAIGPATEFLPAHLTQGIDARRFVAAPLEALVDMILGSMLACAIRISKGHAAPDHERQVIAAILRGLGLEAEEAQNLAAISPAPLVPRKDGFLMRTIRRNGGAENREVVPSARHIDVT